MFLSLCVAACHLDERAFVRNSIYSNKSKIIQKLVFAHLSPGKPKWSSAQAKLQCRVQPGSVGQARIPLWFKVLGWNTVARAPSAATQQQFLCRSITALFPINETPERLFLSSCCWPDDSREFMYMQFSRQLNRHVEMMQRAMHSYASVSRSKTVSSLFRGFSPLLLKALLYQTWVEFPGLCTPLSSQKMQSMWLRSHLRWDYCIGAFSCA